MPLSILRQLYKRKTTQLSLTMYFEVKVNKSYINIALFLVFKTLLTETANKNSCTTTHTMC